MGIVMRTLEALEDVNLKPEFILAIQELGKKFDMDQIVLFGSRARKTNWERSDIDLRISTFDSEVHLEFEDALNELDTLLMFDVVNRRSFQYSAELDKEIERDGVILYEKV